MMRRRCERERGTIAVAMLVLLAVFQFIVAAVVMSGARSAELTVLRLDTARAFYAAEAGANMSLRELFTQTDLDADGGIGSISDDANDANDPALGEARCVSAVVTSGSETTVTVTGRGGEAVRVIQIVVE